MDDVISRRVVIKTVKNVRDVCDTESLDDYRDLLVACFEVLPSAQPELPIKKKCTICPHCDNCDVNDDGTIAQQEQRWIPCSERLPKAENCPMDCLVTRKSKFIGNYTDMAVCEKNGTWTHEDWDAIVLGDVEDGKSTGLISTRDDNIIAWMPLPDCYQKEGEAE